jgi:hypothetical protein
MDTYPSISQKICAAGLSARGPGIFAPTPHVEVKFQNCATLAQTI